jgi:hypothetical protein
MAQTILLTPQCLIHRPALVCRRLHPQSSIASTKAVLDLSRTYYKPVAFAFELLLARKPAPSVMSDRATACYQHIGDRLEQLGFANVPEPVVICPFCQLVFYRMQVSLMANRHGLVGIAQMPWFTGHCIKLGKLGSLALCRCRKESSKSLLSL